MDRSLRTVSHPVDQGIVYAYMRPVSVSDQISSFMTSQLLLWLVALATQRQDCLA